MEYFVLNTAGLRDWLTLPQEDTLTANVELPDEIGRVFDEVVEVIRASAQPQALLSHVKMELIRRFGGFDESVYGYSQFKQMMEEGARRGFFVLGVNDRLVDYAMLPDAASDGN
ncbi:MAG: hypothetical protein Kow00120_23310 [Anaerolineae bacterium]